MPSRRHRPARLSKPAEHPVVVVAKAIRQAQRLKARTEHLRDRLRGYGLSSEIVQITETIVSSAVHLRQALASVPPDWKAARGSANGTPALRLGDRVHLKPSAIKKLGGIVRRDQVFTIDRIVGIRLIVRGEEDDGTSLLLPMSRTNLVRAPS